MNPPRPAVFDCNVFLQAMLSSRGAAYACWQRVLGGDVTLYLTAFILIEIRRLPEHRELRRFRHFTPDRVERFIEELLEIAVVVAPPPDTFSYPRDPDDAHYVNLAISSQANLVVSNDKDLLDLMQDTNADGKRVRAAHPGLRIFTPPQFLAVLPPKSR